jgi:ADP-ribose pyrophosphatase
MADPDLSDRPAEVELGAPELIGRGLYRYETYRATLHENPKHPLSRDVVRVGRVVVILPLDLERDEIVLIREFRLGAQLATGKGDVVELPAGRVEAGEDLADAARRECLEEIGIEPKSLVPGFSVLPSPGILDEHQSYFIALVDSTKVPERAGAAHEHEDTRPMRVPVDRALAALAGGTMRYGALVVGLQWLALNRHRLAEIVKRGGPTP